jgi:NAD(P)-dependent dehydrogenase (short-subunit alcohol dehydrogenase family)
MPGRFDGKVVAVAGGSTGIGRASALGLAREGARLAIASRGETELERTAEEIRSQGAPCLAVQADFSNRGDADRFIGAATSEYGGLDVLVNVVGGGPRGPFLELSDDDWVTAIEATLLSDVRLCRAAIPHLQRRGGGAIVCVSASSTHHHIIGNVAYTAAKSALNSLVKSLSKEFASDNIRVNAVAPGYSVGERMRAAQEEIARAEGTGTREVWEKQAREFGFFPDLGRPGAPEDQANAILYLASDQASYVTGIVLPVEGGATESQ